MSKTELAAKRGNELKLEYRKILALVTRPVSIMEIGAWLHVPAGVVRVLVSDLADAGYLTTHTPPPTEPDGRPSTELLERLLEGLRAL